MLISDMKLSLRRGNSYRPACGTKVSSRTCSYGLLWPKSRSATIPAVSKIMTFLHACQYISVFFHLPEAFLLLSRAFREINHSDGYVDPLSRYLQSNQDSSDGKTCEVKAFRTNPLQSNCCNLNQYPRQYIYEYRQENAYI